MKAFFGILSVVSLLTFSVACNRDSGMSNPTKDVQREEAIDGDDLRETDNYEQALPAKEEEAVQRDESSAE